MRRRAALFAVALAGCGRFGFDAASRDAAIDAVPDAPSCDQPARGDFAIWPMPNPSPGLPNAASHTVTADGMAVIDDVTGLMWQRASQGGMTQDEGKMYCESLVSEGLCDWRLP